MEGGTEGSGSGRDPHGVVDGRRKQKKTAAKEQQTNSGSAKLWKSGDGRNK